jgi:hypothetical protein
LFQLIDRLIKFLIYIGVAIASLLFTYAGYLYITAGGGHGVEEAKGIFKDVFIGLVIALCGYLIVDTILRSIVSGSFAGPSWQTIQCVNRDISQVAGKGIGFANLPNLRGLVVNESAPSPIGGGSVSPGSYSDSVARTTLASAGITINKDACTAGQTNCTSLEGIRQDTVTQVVNLKQACNCSFVFTGGTEGGHSDGATSHSSGYKADVSLSPALDSYIQSAFTSIGFRSDDNAPQFRDQYGNIYAREGDHWDILINKGTGPLPKQ